MPSRYTPDDCLKMENGRVGRKRLAKDLPLLSAGFVFWDKVYTTTKVSQLTIRIRVAFRIRRYMCYVFVYVLYYIVSYCIVLYCIVLYCTDATTRATPDFHFSLTRVSISFLFFSFQTRHDSLGSNERY